MSKRRMLATTMTALLLAGGWGCGSDRQTGMKASTDDVPGEDVPSAELTPEQLRERYYRDGVYAPPPYTPNPGTPGECVTTEQCLAMYGDVPWPYASPEDVECVVDPGSGLGRCAECATDDDCAEGHRCHHETFCLAIDLRRFGCERDEECKREAESANEVFSPLHPVRCYMNHYRAGSEHPRGSHCGQCRTDVDCTEGGYCSGTHMSQCVEPCETDADCPWDGFVCKEESGWCGCKEERGCRGYPYP